MILAAFLLFGSFSNSPEVPLPLNPGKPVSLLYEGSTPPVLIVEAFYGAELGRFSVPRVEGFAQLEFRPTDLWPLRGLYRDAYKIRLESPKRQVSEFNPPTGLWKVGLKSHESQAVDYHITFPDSPFLEKKIYKIQFETSDPEALRRAPPLNLFLETDRQERRSLWLGPRHGVITIYEDTLRAPLRTLEIQAVPPHTRIQNVSQEEVETTGPLPSDLGTILQRGPETWRQPGYELYEWSAFPGVLVYAFKNHLVQTLTLSRLAFFVEKRGFRGTLLSNARLKTMRGYNAHNYRPEDLADFFNKAAETRFTLNPEELELRATLVQQGLLTELPSSYPSQVRYAAGQGAVLSISWQSGPLNRALLLNHESYHGFFFTNEDYRKAVKAIWDALPANEKGIWLDFLRFNNYDERWEYLAYNEFHAYILQQVPREWPYYLRTRILNRSRKTKRGSERIFLQATEAVYEAAWRWGGLLPGRAIEWR